MAEFCVTLEIVNAVRHHAKAQFSHTDSTTGKDGSLLASSLCQSEYRTRGDLKCSERCTLIVISYKAHFDYQQHK